MPIHMIGEVSWDPKEDEHIGIQSSLTSCKEGDRGFTTVLEFLNNLIEARNRVVLPSSRLHSLVESVSLESILGLLKSL